MVGGGQGTVTRENYGAGKCRGGGKKRAESSNLKMTGGGQI